MTKFLMTASSLFLLLIGLILTFLPQETLTFMGSSPLKLPTLLVQIAGALYLGFAIVNWTARGAIVGGIYNRPVSLGNFLHFGAGAAGLLRGVAGGQHDSFLVVIALMYLLFALWFCRVIFTHPLQTSK